MVSDGVERAAGQLRDFALGVAPEVGQHDDFAFGVGQSQDGSATLMGVHPGPLGRVCGCEHVEQLSGRAPKVSPFGSTDHLDRLPMGTAEQPGLRGFPFGSVAALLPAEGGEDVVNDVLRELIITGDLLGQGQAPSAMQSIERLGAYWFLRAWASLDRLAER